MGHAPRALLEPLPGLRLSSPVTAAGAAAADFRGGGKPDILWRNDSTGAVYMMLMNGLAIASQGLVYTEPDTAWKIVGPWEYAQ